MPWQCFPGTGRPFPSNWQHSATRSSYISSLSQNWFRSKSKLVQIWFKTYSDLNHFWNWFRLEMYNLLVAWFRQLPGNCFTVPGKNFYVIKFYSPGIIFLKKCQSGFCHFGVPGKMHQICWSLARPWALIQNWSISDSSLNLGHTLQRRLLLYTQQYERFKYD